MKSRKLNVSVMIIKGVINSKDLEEQKKLFIKTVKAFEPHLNFSPDFISSIINKACEIQCKENALGFTYNQDIVIPSNSSNFQTIYYAQDGAFVKGLINCVSNRKMIQPINDVTKTNICSACSLSVECKRKRKHHCYRMEVQELAGISGGGSALLNEVICKAFYKGFMYVYLVPAGTTKDQNLIDYYTKFAEKNNIKFIYDKNYFYFYPFF